MKNILILTAHDDDEILGAGGAIQYYKENGYSVYVCQATDGSSIQYDDSEVIKKRFKQHQEAIKVLGVDKVFKLDFFDGQLDIMPNYKINNAINKIFKEIKPEVLFTHSNTDIHQDHKEIYKSTLVITRPLNNFLKKVFCYEVPSATEWNPEKLFIPNYFLNIEKYINKKIKAFSIMETEVRKFPHPRSIKGIEILAQYRGMQSGSKYSEAYKLIKSYN